MNIAIIIHSKTGHTLQVGEALRSRLETSGHTVHLEQIRAANESCQGPKNCTKHK